MHENSSVDVYIRGRILIANLKSRGEVFRAFCIFSTAGRGFRGHPENDRRALVAASDQSSAGHGPPEAKLFICFAKRHSSTQTDSHKTLQAWGSNDQVGPLTLSCLSRPAFDDRSLETSAVWSPLLNQLQLMNRQQSFHMKVHLSTKHYVHSWLPQGWSQALYCTR